ncbi:protein NRT1/ PTR FAMILY 1.2-like [Camellia sinensis]|nr:protein NRT1/ PTR FAMILY 1.2-like [Camellia sinensis]
MTLLWLTAMLPQLKPPSCEHFINSTCNNSPTSAQLAVLFSSFGLISIGAGCIRPCSMAFGADQLDNKDNPDNDRALQSFFNWYYASTGLSTVLALTVIVYNQEHLGWQVGFRIPVVFMVFSALMFLLGSSLYIKVVASESLFTSFVQVLVAARRNRKNRYSDDFHHKSLEPKFCAPTENLRCLNKACIITDPERDLNPDGSASNPWHLCTVEQVESLKALLKAIPMFSAGIMVILVICQNSFSTLQAKTMNRHINSSFEIPAGSFSVFMIVTLTLWVTFYDRFMVALLAKCTGRPLGLSPRVRMGIGLLLSCLATVVSAVIERKRRSKAIEQGFQEDPNAVVDMTAMWLVPQYAILGLAEAFYSIGQRVLLQSVP